MHTWACFGLGREEASERYVGERNARFRNNSYDSDADKFTILNVYDCIQRIWSLLALLVDA
jgi:hypothetical protein